MKRKITALFLCVMMLLSIVPFAVSAADEVVITEVSDSTGFAQLANGGNFKLTADITVTARVEVNSKTINLDLNGHTITATSSVENTMIKLGNATLNIFDTSDAKTGTIAAGDGCVSSCIQGNTCTLNIVGGKITGWKSNTGNYKGVFQFANACTVNFYDCKITNCSNTDGIVRAKGTTVVNLYNAELENNTCTMFADYGETPTFNIVGGVIKDAVTAALINGTVNIVGGTFKTSPDAAFFDATAYEVVDADGMFKVQSKTGEAPVIPDAPTFPVASEGTEEGGGEEGTTPPDEGEITWVEIADAAAFNAAPKEGHIKLTGDVIGAAQVIVNETSLTIDLNGHTLQAAVIGNYFLRTHYSAGEINIYDTAGGGKIIPATGDTTSYFFSTNSGTLNVYGGTITDWKPAAQPVIANAYGFANFYGGKITNCSSTVAIFRSKNPAKGYVNITENFVIEGNDLSVGPLFADDGGDLGVFNISGGIINEDIISRFISDKSGIVITGGTFKNEPDANYYDVEKYEVVKVGEMYEIKERIFLAKDNGDGTHIVLDPSNPDVGKNMPHYGGTATCEAKARCELCIVEYGDFAPHNKDKIEPGREATCSKMGLTDAKRCSVCDTIVEKAELIPTLEHTPGEWKVIKEAAVGVEGSKIQKCSECNKELQKEAIPALTDSNVGGGDTNTGDNTEQPEENFPTTVVIIIAVAVVVVAAVVVVVIVIKKKKTQSED